MNAVMATAEDEEGTAVLLQLYNQPEDVEADDLLPQSSVHIIKEPFFKVTTDGKYSLRVDHVSDDLLLSVNDERIPKRYSDALSFATTVAQEQAALLNRSLANLRLGRPEKALADALRARHGNEPTEKGLFREVKALYRMEQFNLCLEKLQQVVDLNPNN
ncbi:hypothetical protein KNSL1_013786 [Colletotrichum chrysophilum]|nr:hypothetical protein KNSL1_013786 [Colletotrichum chrysophilum]